MFLVLIQLSMIIYHMITHVTDIGFLAHSETEIDATDYKPGQ